MNMEVQIPMCCNCKHARQIPLTSDMLCEIHGVVTSDYCCKKYTYNLFLIKSKRKRNINFEEFSAEDFSIEVE